MNRSEKSGKLFNNPFLEKLSRPDALVVIILIVILSLPVFVYGIINVNLNIPVQAGIYISGFIFFTLAEYLIHRFIYHHGEYTNEQNWQFKIHGVHHAYPRDKERLSLPLPLIIIIASIFYFIFRILMGSYALLFFPGFIDGYAFYLFVHFMIHTMRPPKNVFHVLWKHHYLHHYKDDKKAFGVTTPFWDIIFGTMPSKEKLKKINYSIFASLLFLSSASFAQPFPGKIGVGLDGIGGIALEFPNATLTAGDWQSVASGGNANTDSLGWPTEDFRVIFFDHRPFNAWNNAPDDPQKYVIDLSGTYTLSFEGQANLTSWCDAPVVFQNQVYDTTGNTTTLEIVFPPGGGIDSATIGNYGFFMLNFLQTNYGTGISGVKNIRLMRPGYQHNNPQIFRTAYLNAMSPFSTLRFMDYLSTNNIDNGYPNIKTWADRQLPNAPRYDKGAPWETIMALANYTCRDIWINIPVDADSMYVVELANLMNADLRQEINIYIEYSNEVWNGGFTQYQYNYDAVLFSPEDSDIRAGTPWDDRRRARRVAKQVIKFGKIFENVMGITVASGTRIRPVFAWQIGGWLPWYDDVLNWINTTYGAPKNFIYGIASAPYFGEGGAASNATPQQVVNAMSVSSDSNVTNIQTLAQYAGQWQLKHLQYEGGPDNGGGSTTNIGNRITANRIPEMKTAVIHNYMDNWFSANANGTAPAGTNDVVNYFVMSGGVSRYGCWGATEDLNYLQNLSSTPKYDALCFLTGMCGNEPTVSLTAPVNNATVPVNSIVNVLANASDPDGTVKKVEFFVGTVLIGVDSISPFSIQWTPTQTGIVAVLAKSIDNDGKFTFTDANVINVVSNTTGIKENQNNIDIRIFPVPVDDVLEITVSGITDPNGKIEIRDALGKLLIIRPVYDLINKIDVSDLEDGIYFLTLKIGKGNYTKKIIKMRR